MNGLPKPCYVMSEPHLSGYRVVLGYETLTEAQDAQSALAASPPAREEAPAEGAGEIEDILIDCFEPKAYGIPRTNVASAVKRILALRNRTSEPEAGAFEPKYLAAFMADKGVVHLNPAPATADKLRVAVEALKSAREDLIAFATARASEYEGTREDATYEIDQALSALNEQPQ